MAFFSLKSAYLLATGSNPLNLDTHSTAWIWKAETHPWVQFFIWLCLHNSLPTREVLGSRGLNLNPIWTVCHLDNEFVDHLLRKCNVAQELWRRLKSTSSCYCTLLTNQLRIGCVKYISNAMCYIMLCMLEWMRKMKHRIGTLRTRELRGSTLTAYIHGGIP